jgi:surfactin synthase thioesterase subunit
MEHVWSEARPPISQPVIVTGHSLGAARADVICRLMVPDGAPPAERMAAQRLSSTANSK